MRSASLALTGLIALQHLWFLVLETFLFTTPVGLSTFKITQDFANQAAVLAMNQGLSNGFLAEGLIWSLSSDKAGGSSSSAAWRWPGSSAPSPWARRSSSFKRCPHCWRSG